MSTTGWVRIDKDSHFTKDAEWMFSLGRYEDPQTPTLIARVFVNHQFEVTRHEISFGRCTLPFAIQGQELRKRLGLVKTLTTNDLLSTAIQLARQWPSEPDTVHDVNYGSLA